jgi:hypothetical protein
LALPLVRKACGLGTVATTEEGVKRKLRLSFGENCLVIFTLVTGITRTLGMMGSFTGLFGV